MIKIKCNVEDKEKLKTIVYDELVNMTMEVVYPITFKKYEDYGIDSSNEDAQKKFAALHLGNPDDILEVADDGVVINDEFNVEDTYSEDEYDIEQFLHNIREKYPQAKFSGEGSIDYHYSMTEYSIADDGTNLEVTYEGY